MKIGLISDIHGNSFALKKVISVLRRQGVKEIYCLGDLVGYYPDINEVFNLIRKNNVKCILGNHDYSLIKKIPVNDSEVGIDSFELSTKKINEENLNFLMRLKDHMILKIGNKKALFVHGSPWDKLGGYIFGEEVSSRPFGEVDAEIIIMGGTHRPFIKKYGKKIIVNCGSVGQPRDKDKRAGFIVWDTDAGSLKIIRSKYEYKKAYDKFKIECKEETLNKLIK